MKEDRSLQSLEPADRGAWRAWLAENHSKSGGIWLILHKKASNRQTLSYPDAVEEALCFGWIDSLTRRLDDQRYTFFVGPRRPGGVWSRSNKERIKKLVERSLMTDAGLRPIEAAQRDGSWNQLDAIDDLTIPADLQQAFAANTVAEANFMAFNSSAKKMILWWITSAKRPETRARRVAETVAQAEHNVKAIRDQR